MQFLSATTFLAKVGADVVVLDARNSAYFCLPGAAEAMRTQDGQVTFSDPDLALAFEDAGFLVHGPAPRPAGGLRRPTRDLGQAVAERVTIGDLALILRAWLWMLPAYHGRRFDRLLNTARRGRKADASAEPSAEVQRLVAAFERVLPWLPFQGVCLYRAFLLMRILRWRGHHARWVFGVHTWPFQAHCWLQIGDTALDDAADRLTAFEPIMEV